MSEIARKIKDKKVQTEVYKYSVITDRYGNESYGYAADVSFSINVMWTPVNSEAEVAEYGERVNEMLQACLFTKEAIEEHDRVVISNSKYNVIAIKPYPSYRLLIVERV